MKFKIGKNSTIFMGCSFDCAAGILIGKNCVINSRCRLDNRAGIEIGDNVAVSTDVIMLTADHDLDTPDFVGRHKKIVIANYAWIGTRAMILPGVKIGEGVVIGAGSVVTRDIAPFSLAAGIPARVIKSRPQNLTYNTAYRRLFH